MSQHKLPTVQEITDLLTHCQQFITDDHCAFEDTEDDATPSMMITVGINTENGEWGYQTGDNSYTGAAYHYPTWGVGYLYRDSDCEEVAKEILEDAENCLY